MWEGLRVPVFSPNLMSKHGVKESALDVYSREAQNSEKMDGHAVPELEHRGSSVSSSVALPLATSSLLACAYCTSKNSLEFHDWLASRHMLPFLSLIVAICSVYAVITWAVLAINCLCRVRSFKGREDVVGICMPQAGYTYLRVRMVGLYSLFLLLSFVLAPTAVQVVSSFWPPSASGREPRETPDSVPPASPIHDDEQETGPYFDASAFPFLRENLNALRESSSTYFQIFSATLQQAGSYVLSAPPPNSGVHAEERRENVRFFRAKWRGMCQSGFSSMDLGATAMKINAIVQAEVAEEEAVDLAVPTTKEVASVKIFQLMCDREFPHVNPYSYLAYSGSEIPSALVSEYLEGLPSNSILIYFYNSHIREAVRGGISMLKLIFSVLAQLLCEAVPEPIMRGYIFPVWGKSTGIGGELLSRLSRFCVELVGQLNVVSSSWLGRVFSFLSASTQASVLELQNYIFQEHAIYAYDLNSDLYPETNIRYFSTLYLSCLGLVVGFSLCSVILAVGWGAFYVGFRFLKGFPKKDTEASETPASLMALEILSAVMGTFLAVGWMDRCSTCSEHTHFLDENSYSLFTGVINLICVSGQTMCRGLGNIFSETSSSLCVEGSGVDMGLWLYHVVVCFIDNVLIKRPYDIAHNYLHKAITVTDSPPPTLADYHSYLPLEHPFTMSFFFGIVISFFAAKGLRKRFPKWTISLEMPAGQKLYSNIVDVAKTEAEHSYPQRGKLHNVSPALVISSPPLRNSASWKGEESSYSMENSKRENSPLWLEQASFTTRNLCHLLRKTQSLLSAHLYNSKTNLFPLAKGSDYRMNAEKPGNVLNTVENKAGFITKTKSPTTTPIYNCEGQKNPLLSFVEESSEGPETPVTPPEPHSVPTNRTVLRKIPRTTIINDNNTTQFRTDKEYTPLPAPPSQAESEGLSVPPSYEAYGKTQSETSNPRDILFPKKIGQPLYKFLKSSPLDHSDLLTCLCSLALTPGEQNMRTNSPPWYCEGENETAPVSFSGRVTFFLKRMLQELSPAVIQQALSYTGPLSALKHQERVVAELCRLPHLRERIRITLFGLTIGQSFRKILIQVRLLKDGLADLEKGDFLVVDKLRLFSLLVGVQRDALLSHMIEMSPENLSEQGREFLANSGEAIFAANITRFDQANKYMHRNPTLLGKMLADFSEELELLDKAIVEHAEVYSSEVEISPELRGYKNSKNLLKDSNMPRSQSCREESEKVGHSTLGTLYSYKISGRNSQEILKTEISLCFESYERLNTRLGIEGVHMTADLDKPAEMSTNLLQIIQFLIQSAQFIKLCREEYQIVPAKNGARIDSVGEKMHDKNSDESEMGAATANHKIIGSAEVERGENSEHIENEISGNNLDASMTESRQIDKNNDGLSLKKGEAISETDPPPARVITRNLDSDSRIPRPNMDGRRDGIPLNRRNSVKASAEDRFYSLLLSDKSNSRMYNEGNGSGNPKTDGNDTNHNSRNNSSNSSRSRAESLRFSKTPLPLDGAGRTRVTPQKRVESLRENRRNTDHNVDRSVTYEKTMHTRGSMSVRTEQSSESNISPRKGTRLVCENYYSRYSQTKRVDSNGLDATHGDLSKITHISQTQPNKTLDRLDVFPFRGDTEGSSIKGSIKGKGEGGNNIHLTEGGDTKHPLSSKAGKKSPSVTFDSQLEQVSPESSYKQKNPHNNGDSCMLQNMSHNSSQDDTRKNSETSYHKNAAANEAESESQNNSAEMQNGKIHNISRQNIPLREEETSLRPSNKSASLETLPTQQLTQEHSRSLSAEHLCLSPKTESKSSSSRMAEWYMEQRRLAAERTRQNERTSSLDSMARRCYRGRRILAQNVTSPHGRARDPLHQSASLSPVLQPRKGDFFPLRDCRSLQENKPRMSPSSTQKPNSHLPYSGYSKQKGEVASPGIRGVGMSPPLPPLPSGTRSASFSYIPLEQTKVDEFMLNGSHLEAMAKNSKKPNFSDQHNRNLQKVASPGNKEPFDSPFIPRYMAAKNSPIIGGIGDPLSANSTPLLPQCFPESPNPRSPKSTRGYQLDPLGAQAPNAFSTLFSSPSSQEQIPNIDTRRRNPAHEEASKMMNRPLPS